MNRNLIFISICLFYLIIGCGDTITEVEDNTFVWGTSSPAEQGMNSQILDSAFIKAEQLGFVDCILVIRNRFIVAEEYYNGYNATTPHNTWSVSKSFLSALTGIALNKGFLKSLEEKVLDYFPEYVFPGMDPRKYDITINHLLTMRMGIDGEKANYMEVYNSDNWIKSTLELPLIFSPGEGYRYNAFETHLLSGVITKSLGTSIREFANLYLTGPMGITIGFWEQDPQGYYFGGNSMHFTPRDMAVLGYLYLNEGRLNNKQIVPQEWVEFTLTPSTNWGNNKWGAMEDYNYGYLWWLSKLNNYDSFMAFGYAGQLVITLPDLNLIIVTTANSNVDWDGADSQEFEILDLISKYILTAL